MGSSPALGDIDNDGFIEVVVGSHDNKVYGLDGSDNDPPSCEITVPVEEYLHILNIPTRIKMGTIIIGFINIRVTANDFGGSGVDRVEFYIDNVLKHNTTEIPYNWLCTDRMLGIHTLTVIAYDKAGNKGESQEITALWYIFL